MKHLARTFDLVPTGQPDPLEDYILSAELRAVLDEEKELRDDYVNMIDGVNKISEEYRKFFPKQVSDITEVDIQIQLVQQEIQEILTKRFENFESPDEEVPEPAEPETPESKKQKKERKNLVRLYYGKITNLTHPDKTRHRKYSKEIREHLIGLFYRARQAYQHKDLEALIEMYGEATLIASGKTLDEVEENKRERIEQLRQKIQGILQDIENAKQHPLYSVYDMHNSGHLSQAKGVYRQILGHILHDKDSELKQLQIQLKMMKDNDEWTTL